MEHHPVNRITHRDTSTCSVLRLLLHQYLISLSPKTISTTLSLLQNLLKRQNRRETFLNLYRFIPRSTTSSIAPLNSPHHLNLPRSAKSLESLETNLFTYCNVQSTYTPSRCKFLINLVAVIFSQRLYARVCDLVKVEHLVKNFTNHAQVLRRNQFSWMGAYS